MCGIVSIFAYNSDAPSIDQQELLRIRDRMIARGPDGSGIWISTDSRIGLAHRRLSIIDLTEKGSQPMANADGSLIVTFNGEIYNYRELRANLENKGYRFRSNSDTEVLLHLYSDWGKDMVHHLRGMYAFAIWDERKKGLFLARDPFGIKPLYYSDDGKIFRAASQVKALLAGGCIDTTAEPAGHVGFFLWGHVPEPYTLYRGIRAMPAGSYLWVQDTKFASNAPPLTTHQFCSVPEELSKAEQKPILLTGSDLREYLGEILLDSVRCHLLADVPVGVFLSSGLDSTTLTALASKVVSEPLHTVTLGFQEYQGTDRDEVPLAEQVARHYGTVHKTIWVKKNDFQRELQLLLNAMDQPSIDGVNSYFVSKAAVQAGLKVAISGLGGDELFGSYLSFKQIPRLVRLCSAADRLPGFGKGVRLIASSFLKHIASPKYAGIFEYGASYGGAYFLRRALYMPWELPGLLDSEMVQEGLQELRTIQRLAQTIDGVTTAHHKVSALEMSWYMRNQLLRDADWSSMAHSLEVRVPFLDLNLLRNVAPLLGRQYSPNKQIIAAAVSNLPDSVINRKKTGFAVPVREWILNEVGNGGERGLRGWALKIYEGIEINLA